MRDLCSLLDTVAIALPGLGGKIGQPGPDQLVCGSVGNTDRIQRLYGGCRHAHPEAGPHYWSARSWSLLIWQPVYLTVLAVHLAGRVPRLSIMGQSVMEGTVAGFVMPAHQPRVVGPGRPFDVAARQLRAWLARQWREAAAVFRIHTRMADRLAADYVLAALLLVQRRLGLAHAELHRLEARWLDALGMSGCSSLIDVSLEDGRTCLALGRKVCCQHFRRADGGLCSTCPKLEPQERLIRLRQELAAL
jgi:siderophore ferric iron reductase